MADKKISALTGATTPLAGTEVLPIVQSGATVKVAVSDLTAGRAVSATQLTSTVAIGTAPLVVTSTTNVANLNASSLNGATFAAPGAIGGGTAAAGNFTTLGLSGAVTSSKTGVFIDATSGGGTSSRLAGFGNSQNASYVGVEGSVGGVSIPGSTAYATLFYSGYNYPMQFGVNNTLQLSLTTTTCTFTGINLVQGTAAKGINFTANTPAAGMTSQLFKWYEEGTWTPTDASGAGLAFTSVTGFYIKIGSQVTAWFALTYPVTADTGVSQLAGLPFIVSGAYAANGGGGMMGYTTEATLSSCRALNTEYVLLQTAAGPQVRNNIMSGDTVVAAVTYVV